MNIVLLGAGMGTARTLTLEGREALAEAEAVIGAQRLIAGLPDDIAAEKIPLALPEKIAGAIEEHPRWKNVCVVLSGDVGFYSGAKRLLELLRRHTLKLIPGIATPQYFAARLQRPWQDFRLVSAHGVYCDVLAETLNHPAVLFLTGGATTPDILIGELCGAGLRRAKVTVGENLSSPDERITAAAAGELEGRRDFSPLSVVLVENDKRFAREARSPGIADGEFIRGKTPMTKREVRVLALSLLALRQDDIVYDIGSGTGSVAVEAALLARRGRVYAVENDRDAFTLLNANREKFGVWTVRPIFGSAPEALEDLPPPQAVFIGGSKGAMRDILEAVLQKNPHARLVASAIALETISSVMTAMRELEVRNVDVVQLAANRVVVRGGYHMLEARNPVFLISGGGE